LCILAYNQSIPHERYKYNYIFALMNINKTYLSVYIYTHTHTHISPIIHRTHTLSMTKLPNMTTTLNHLFDLPGQICHVQCGFCTTILLVYLNFFSYSLPSFLPSSLYIYDHEFNECKCVAGECTVYKLVNGGDCEMWALHKPSLCQFDEGFLHSSPSPCFSLPS